MGAKRRERAGEEADRGRDLRSQTTSFIVRLWLEPASEEGEQQPCWRGHIRHVQTGEALYFHDLHQMIRFVEERSDPHLPPLIRTGSLEKRTRRQRAQEG